MTGLVLALAQATTVPDSR